MVRTEAGKDNPSRDTAAAKPPNGSPARGRRRIRDKFDDSLSDSPWVDKDEIWAGIEALAKSCKVPQADIMREILTDVAGIPADRLDRTNHPCPCKHC